MKKIQIQINDHCLHAVLHETPAGQAIWDALPIQAKGNLWGDEIYFPVEAKINMEKGREVVEEGALAFWPPGLAFCIFYGPTPMSAPGEIRPASEVEVVGKITSDFRVLKHIKSSPSVMINRLERCDQHEFGSR